MRLIMATHSSNPDYNADCDFVEVDLTPEHAKKLLRWIALTNEIDAKEKDLAEIQFQDFGALKAYCWCDEYDAITQGDDLTDEVWNADGLPEIPEEHWQSTECTCFVICGNGGSLFWTFLPRHSDIDINTAYLEMETLEQIAGQSA